MPLTRYGGASKLNRNQHFHTHNQDIGDNRLNSLYCSSPDLANSGGPHRRCSSSDSMDGSHSSGTSGQSSQSSDFQEVSYPTRSTSMSRKVSTSADPLQFIKLRSAEDLAHTAEVQMRVAAESKKSTPSSKSRDDDNADWQANLSTWKNRRKSQSERAYHLKDELEQMEKEKLRDSGPALPAKTFSQITDERNRRRSTGRRKFYPIEDEEDNDFVDAGKQQALPFTQRETLKPNDGIAPWAIDSRDEEKDGQNMDSSRFAIESSSTYSDQNDRNNNSYSVKHLNVEPLHRSGRSKLSQNLPDSDEGVTTFGKFGDDQINKLIFEDQEIICQEGAQLMMFYNNQMRANNELQTGDSLKEKESLSHLTKDLQIEDTRSQNILRQANIASGSNDEFNKTEDVFSESDSLYVHDSNISKITIGLAGSRTQSEIGSIVKTSKESELKPALSKSGSNEKDDMTVRMSIFQNFQADDDNRILEHLDSLTNVLAKDGHSDEENFQEDVASQYNCKTSSFMVMKPNSSASATSQHETSSQSTSSQCIAVCENNGKKIKDFVEKTIRISQTPNSDKGFGFFLTGGIDRGVPITVSKVSLGSAADLFELKAEDVILSLNQINVSGMTSSDVGDIISKAVVVGFIDIRVKRKYENDDFDDEAFSSNDENEESTLSSQFKESHTKESKTVPMTEDIPREKVNASSMNERFLMSAKEIRVEVLEPDVPKVNRPHDSNSDGGTFSPVSSYVQPSPSSSVCYEEERNGPPPSLRKWQRQRQKEEYIFAQGSDQTDTYKRISLNAPLTGTGSDEKRIAEVHSPEEMNTRSTKSWDKRVDIRTRKQNDQTQEKEMLEPKEDKTRPLEEHKAEGKGRVQQGAAMCALPPPLTHDQILLQATATSKSDSSGMTFSVMPFQQQQQEQPQSFYAQSSVSAVDSRNKDGLSNNLTPVQFQVRVGSQQATGQGTTAETERNCIHREELIELEEECQKVEREIKAKEMEEKWRIKEKEEALEREKELLQLERERFIQEQEEFKRQREQLKYEQHQLQQHSYSNPPMQYHIALASNADHNSYIASQDMREQSPNTLTEPFNLHRPKHMKSCTESHQDIYHSPEKNKSLEYEKTSMSSKHSPKQQSLTQDQERQKQNFILRNDVIKSSSNLPKWPPTSGSNHGTKANNGESEQTSSGRRFSRDEMLAMNRKPTPMQKLSEVQQSVIEIPDQQNSVPITREAPSRRQIISLNSAPRAKLKHDKEWYSPVISFQTPYSVSPNQPAQQKYKTPCSEAREADVGKQYSFAGPEDHWLVQEAERRRLAESENRQQANRSVQHEFILSQEYPGPIKPAMDRPNRWRDNNKYSTGAVREAVSMPAAIKQTLLQRAAGARGYNELPPSCSPSHVDLHAYHQQDNYHYQSNKPLPLMGQSYHHHQNREPQLPFSFHRQSNAYAPLNIQAQAASGEGANPVSGTQLCSHCNQELGFGAAMVIESLGIFYHIQCFRCYVCHASLGTGIQGEDVRVRVNKLHCPNCYSNDEAGLKFSKV